MRVAARYFYWPRLSEGLPGRGKTKGKKEGKNAKQARKKRGVERVDPVIFFRPDFTGDEQISPRGVSTGSPFFVVFQTIAVTDEHRPVSTCYSLCNAGSAIQRLFASLFYFGILLADCENLRKFIFHAFGVSFVLHNFHKLPQTRKNPRSKIVFESWKRKRRHPVRYLFRSFEIKSISNSVIFTLLDVLRDERTCPRKLANIHVRFKFSTTKESRITVA